MVVMCLASFTTLLSFGQNEMSEAQIKSMMGSMMGDVKFEGTYYFSKSIVYETFETNSSGVRKNQGKTEILFSEEGENFAIKTMEQNGKPVKEKTIILVDVSANAMITLMEDNSGDKSGMAIKIPKSNMNLSTENSDEAESNVTKTNETRMIKGYMCTKYIGDFDGVNSVVWITDDLDMSLSSVFKDIFKSKSSNFDKMPQGTILESVMTEKNGKKSVMEALEVKTKNMSSYNTKEYNVVSMGQMMQGE